MLGLRYRWGRDTHEMERTLMPPLAQCEDPDREKRVEISSLSERLESIALGDEGNPQHDVSNHDKPEERTIPPAQQQAMRKEAIAKVDQRISDIALRGSFSIEQRGGTKTERSKSSIEDESRFGYIRPPQLLSLIHISEPTRPY